MPQSCPAAVPPPCCCPQCTVVPAVVTYVTNGVTIHVTNAHLAGHKVHLVQQLRRLPAVVLNVLLFLLSLHM
jgi:hypothetical protein